MKDERRSQAEDRRRSDRRRNDRRRGSPPVMQDRRTRFSLLYFFIVVAFVLGLNYMLGQGTSERLPYSELKARIAAGQIDRVVIGPQQMRAEPNDSRVTNYVIYSRGSTSANWSRRAETSSSTFHDSGIPHLQYFVASQDGTPHAYKGMAVEVAVRRDVDRGLVRPGLARLRRRRLRLCAPHPLPLRAPDDPSPRAFQPDPRPHRRAGIFRRRRQPAPKGALAEGRKRPGIMTIDYIRGPNGQGITPPAPPPRTTRSAGTYRRWSTPRPGVRTPPTPPTRCRWSSSRRRGRRSGKPGCGPTAALPRSAPP